jgi:tRNA-dihydrouridine synthase
MIGRAAQGRPWLAGQVGRYLAVRRAESAPPLAIQFAIIDRLYDEMLSHYGRAIGRRHARKHLGWALSAAAETAAIPDAVLKAHRARVLTADDPAAVRRHLADAYADFASRAQGGESDRACPQKTRHTPWGSERKAA